MATDDFAIVIGIAHYHDLQALEGPVRDAQLVYQWLTGAGEVPVENIELITSAQPPAPARPLMDEIDDAFDVTFSKVQLAPARRLYVYFAGHGCTSFANENDPLLVMVNAKEHEMNRSLNSRSVHDGLRARAQFLEQLFIYDCCRHYQRRAAGRIAAWSYDAPATLAGNVKQVVLCSSRFTEYSFEDGMDDGFERGLFTSALLEGLHGDGAVRRRQAWVVTPNSLSAHLALRVPELARAINRRQEPHTFGDFADQVLVSFTEPVGIPVTIRVPRAAAEVIVEDAINLSPVTRGVAEGHLVSLRLPTGSYHVRLADQDEGKVFGVTRGGPAVLDLAE